MFPLELPHESLVVAQDLSSETINTIDFFNYINDLLLFFLVHITAFWLTSHFVKKY